MAHILLPTDFSHHALNACAYALDLHGSAGNIFTLVHSYMDPVAGYADVVEMGSAYYAASVEGLALFTKRFRGLPGGSDAQVFSAVEYGPLAKALQRLCTSKGADLIVMGTTGAAGFSLFGSNAADVAMSSEVPVLIVPKDAHYQGLRHILLADDLSAVEPRSVALLAGLARRTGAQITIAHVVLDDTQAQDIRSLSVYDDLLADVPYTVMELRDDDVAKALSDIAEKQHMDLVAVLHRHRGLLDSLFHASVTKKLALHSSIPLLVLER